MLDYDIDKMCRVCLQSDLELYLLFDYQNATDGVYLSDMISEMTMFQVRRYDDFPHQICLECMQKVRNAYDFKKQFECSHRKLLSYLESNNKITIDPTPDIKNHKSVQTEESSLFPCEKCDAKFISYSGLRQHRIVSHKGSSHDCRFCSKPFKRVGDLKDHIAMHHPEVKHFNPHECLICNRRFTRKHHLIRHIAKIHKIENENFTDDDNIANHRNTDFQDLEMLNEAETDYENITKVGYLSKTISNKSTEDDEESSGAEDSIGAEDNIGADDSIDAEDNIDAKDSVDAEDNIGAKETIGAADNSFSSDEDEKPLAGLRNLINAKNKDVENISIKEELDVKPDDQRDCSPTLEEKESNDKILPLDVGNSAKELKKYKCSICNKAFTRNSHRNRHYFLHVEEKPFSCEICDKRFSRKDHLKSHMSKHDNNGDFKCDICDRSYNKPDILKRHKERKHIVDMDSAVLKSEYCKFCNKSFSSKAYLQKHMKMHTNKSWKCKLCSSGFESKDALKEHNKSHVKEKPFLCSECGLRFVRNDYLLIHMRRHNGEKPYKCQFCDKGFPRATDLNVHVKYHTGEKTHLCTVCGKGFQRSYNLVVHMRVHTGEKPYKCPHCPKDFAQGNDLKAHIRRHTGERYKCNICDVGFVQGYLLTQHKISVHGVQEKRNGRVTKVNVNKSKSEVSLVHTDETIESPKSIKIEPELNL